MITTDTHVYFWNGIYSNWDNCHFNDPIAGLKFENTEQAFMWYKADCFNDDETKKLVAKTPNPKEVKALGRKIASYNEEVWVDRRFNYMVYVNELKLG